MPKEFYILYGSQTGNGEFIAKDLLAKCQENNIPSVCHPLNDVKKVSLKENAEAVFIVCSTTGNGDAPENADGWWRVTKLKSVPKDQYEGVLYAVLGLGDTNYDKFCHMGKTIDKRIHELGGKRIMDIACADEGTGELESVVEKWKEDIFHKIVEIHDHTDGDNDGKSNHDANPTTAAATISVTEQSTPDGDSTLPTAVTTITDMDSNDKNETIVTSDLNPSVTGTNNTEAIAV